MRWVCTWAYHAHVVACNGHVVVGKRANRAVSTGRVGATVRVKRGAFREGEVVVGDVVSRLNVSDQRDPP